VKNYGKKYWFVKSSKIYYFFIRFIVKNCFYFIWKFLINLKASILYYMWFSKRRKFFKLENDFLIVKNDENQKKLSDIILKNLNKLNLNLYKEKMLDGSYISSNQSNTGKKYYTIDLFDKLEFETQQKILDYATSDGVISSASKHLGVFPIISRIKLNYNIKNNHENRGAMLWHRDGFGFKSFDIFLSISDVSKSNGPLYISNIDNKLGVFYRVLGEGENSSPGNVGKLNEKSVNNFKLNSKSISNEGSSGTATFLDSYTTYHRGGNCEKYDRIMLRISYQACDSLDLPAAKNSQFLKYQSINTNNIKSKFLNHLFFYRSSFVEKHNIKKRLVKFYRVLQFYQEV